MGTWEGWMRIVTEPPTAPQATVPVNVQTLLLCVPLFISTYQPAIGTKDACHIPRATDHTPNPRVDTAKAYWQRQEQSPVTTPLSEVTETDVFLSESSSQTDVRPHLTFARAVNTLNHWANPAPRYIVSMSFFFGCFHLWEIRSYPSPLQL